MGIIGVGNMGSQHAKSLLEGRVDGMELAAIADREPAKRDRIKALKGAENVAVFSEGSELIASGLVDAVLVATPHYQHPTLIIDALRHGLHAICEKPAGVYTKQVREMNEEAEKHPELVFAIMFNQRTNCLYRKMREIVKSGEMGEIKRVNWLITNWYRSQSYYDSGAWRATWSGEGGGVLLNQCPHNLDLWQWICGMPKNVRAFMHFGQWHDIEVEDDVTCYAEYENGATGVFITSTGDTPGTNRLEIMLDGGKLVAEDGKLTVWKLKMGEKEFSRTYKGGFGEPEFEKYEAELDGENPQHLGVLRAFTDAVLRGKPLVASGTEGINGLMLSNAMHLSAWLDKTVSLPIDEDLFYKELEKRIKTSRRKEEGASVVLSTEGSYNA